MRDSRDAHLLDSRSFAAVLFDMDGTLITSIEAAERVWTRWAAGHGLDARTFLSHIHGQRAVDSIRSLKIPGATEFVASLPEDRWAVVTSAPRALAARRLEAAGLILPAVLVTAEDVVAGKPDPSGYRLAASRLGVDVTDCAIFEDADIGIRAAEAAGGQLIVITATHAHGSRTAHPSLRDYVALETEFSQGRLRITGTSKGC